jgi:hypothetical protein
MAQERQYLEAGRTGRPVARKTSSINRRTPKRSAIRMEIGTTIGFAIAWLGRLLHPRPIH